MAFHAARAATPGYLIGDRIKRSKRPLHAARVAAENRCGDEIRANRATRGAVKSSGPRPRGWHPELAAGYSVLSFMDTGGIPARGLCPGPTQILRPS